MISYNPPVREVLLVAILAGACTSGCANVGLQVSTDGGTDDLLPSGDLLKTPDLFTLSDAGCTLGTPDRCGTCTTVCPPGKDDGGTLRSCSAATAFGMCGIACRGEWYDVNGMIIDGCELEDAPLQDSFASAQAITLADVVNDPQMLTNPRNLAAALYSDSRTHEQAPIQRPTGRDDYYNITAVGVGDNTKSMTACLGITNFPTDNHFEVCLSNKGVQSFGATGCTICDGGGVSKCVTSPTPSDTGTYYVRIKKMSGSHSSNKYALFLQH
jgi:hypothetical protein